MKKDRKGTVVEDIRDALIRFYSREFVDNMIERLELEIKISCKESEITALGELGKTIESKSVKD